MPVCGHFPRCPGLFIGGVFTPGQTSLLSDFELANQFLHIQCQQRMLNRKPQKILRAYIKWQLGRNLQLLLRTNL